MSKQISLGQFGFTKIVVKKNGGLELCDISSVEASSSKIHACTHCSLKFGNPGAVATHIKCKHGIVPVLQTPKNDSSKKMIEVTEEDNVPDQHQKTKDDRGYRRG